MRVQKEKKKRRYMIWGPVFLVPVLLALLMPCEVNLASHP